MLSHRTEGAWHCTGKPRRVRFIITHGTLGRRSEAQNDLVADFRTACGGESDAAVEVAVIAIGADADNTGANVLACLEDLRLAPAP